MKMSVSKLLLVVNILVIGFVSANPFLRQYNNRENYIVGGVETNIEKNPWQVSLQYKSSHICGGMIIGDRWVLTAAHCTDEDASTLTVRVGSSFYASGGSIIKVKKVIIHEKNNYLDYDFSLIELAKTLTFTDKIQPISLPDADIAVPDSTEALVSGWGVTHSPNESYDKLREANVLIISQNYCKEKYKKDFNVDVTDRMICAGYMEGGKDSCQGDSGGPLSIESNGARVVVGIVSWGKGCAEPKYPGVYSRVSSVRSWIKDISGI